MIRVLLIGVLAVVEACQAAWAGDTILLPLRWCALDGSPAVTSPGTAPVNPYNGMPEPDTDNVLWRRHERTSDNIWIPGANTSFRSGVTAAIRNQASFPIVPDPCPPTNVTLCQGGATAGLSCTPDGTGGSADCDAGVACATQACPAACTFGCQGILGDVLDPGPYCLAGPNRGTGCTPNLMGQDPAVCLPGNACGADLSEYNLAVAACTQAWDALATQFSTTLLGEIAVNINVWVDTFGVRTGLKGRAQRSTVNGNSCAIPPTGVTTATDGAVLVLDNQNFISSDLPFETTNERMVGHELGHTLELWHGDGVDNNANGAYDQVCDSSESTCATPFTFMSSTGCGSLSKTMTTLQGDTARAVGSVYTGATMDPPDSLVQGPNVGDQRGDRLRDVTDTAVDIARVSIQQNASAAITSFTHKLNGVIPFEPDPQRQYVLFVDLDGNAGTGGAPSSLGFDTGFQGAEIVTRVIVTLTGGEIPLLAPFPTLWRFQGGSFVECTAGSDPGCADIHAFLLEILGGDDRNGEALEEPPFPDAHAVQIQVPNSLRGAMGSAVRIQALAQQLSTTLPPESLQTDRLPDQPADGALVLRPVAPIFPECSVTPPAAAPGERVTVAAHGLIENRMAKVFVGDERVATAQTDGSGQTQIEFRLPSNTRPGRRLVTVGVVGTALTADCFVDALQSLPISLIPEAASNVPGGQHTVVATVRDAAGAPRPGITVTFSVVSGPNTGAAGACNPAGCVTDANGQVSFTYTSAGGTGVDQITASFPDVAASSKKKHRGRKRHVLSAATSNTALKFWDADCNLNGIADTCDVGCGGFTGLCGQIIGCGGSLDQDGNGVPDECNRPPDCSGARATPDSAWPPNHVFEQVSVVGVSDPDGDPVTITVTGIFQDEPADVRGSGNTCPDGSGVGSQAARLRNERSGTGDGRVYHLSFVADDGRGGTCTGGITVCVPHDQGGGQTCVDQGALYDSTICR